MAKKGRNKKFGSKKETEIERGYTVVDSGGRRIYLAAHPDGLPLQDAEMLSDGLAADSRVVPIDQVG
jgi:hypothetical protein